MVLQIIIPVFLRSLFPCCGVLSSGSDRGWNPVGGRLEELFPSGNSLWSDGFQEGDPRTRDQREAKAGAVADSERGERLQKQPLCLRAALEGGRKGEATCFSQKESVKAKNGGARASPVETTEN